jgi:hypothetical protein
MKPPTRLAIPSRFRRCPFFFAQNVPLNVQQFPSDPSVLTRDEDHEAKELQLTAIGPLFSEGRRGIDLVVDEQAHAPNDHGPDHQKGHWSLVTGQNQLTRVFWMAEVNPLSQFVVI